jgi:capsid protein
VLDEWMATACAELGLDPADVSRDLVLDVARDVAHGVARPAAPLTAYLLGLAVGRGADAGDAAERITALAGGWSDR